MPANPKYLSTRGQRILKISAGVVGGYLLSGTLHLAVARIPGIGTDLMLTGIWTVFLLWVLLMVLAFLSRNGWVVWAIYLSSSIVFGLLAYYGGAAL